MQSDIFILTPNSVRTVSTIFDVTNMPAALFLDCTLVIPKERMITTSTRYVAWGRVGVRTSASLFS